MDLVQMPWNFLRGWETASSVRSFADGWSTWSTEKEQGKRKQATLVFWYRQSICLAGEQIKIVEQPAGSLCQRWLIPRRRVQLVGFAFQHELEQLIPWWVCCFKVQTTVPASFCRIKSSWRFALLLKVMNKLSRRERDPLCTIPIQVALFINQSRRSSKVCLRFQKEVLDFCRNIPAQCVLTDSCGQRRFVIVF